jgi:L-ascorbate metabolism protein UlaG (beta-lactamase superfamily)
LDRLRDLDAVLISHPHHDHLDVGSLRRIESACPVVAPRGCRWTLRRAGFADLKEVDVGDRVSIAGLEIEAVRAVHDGRRYPLGRRRPALGYLLDGPPSIYFAGDTDLFPEMRDLAGRVEVAALPVTGWGPRVPEGHLDSERAASAVAMIRPRVAIPIHWGTLAAGRKLAAVGRSAPLEFARAVERDTPDVEVRILAPGERLEL